MMRAMCKKAAKIFAHARGVRVVSDSDGCTCQHKCTRMDMGVVRRMIRKKKGCEGRWRRLCKRETEESESVDERVLSIRFPRT